MLQILWCLTAVLTGGAIGFGFGMIQDAALRRNEKRQQTGELTNGWTLMPGSGGRVAYLLIGLVIIQVICPMLFQNGIQWWVSGGLVAGYGCVLYSQLRRKLSVNKH